VNNPDAVVSTERVLSVNPRNVFAAFEQPDRLARSPVTIERKYHD